jgi:hypothetical protein
LSFGDTSALFNNPVYFTGSFATSPFSFTGGAGATYTDLLTVTGLDLSLINSTYSDLVAVNIAFAAPNPANVNIGGTGTLTDVFQLRGFYYSDTGTIAWNGHATVDFADGSSLGLALDDIQLTGIDGFATGSSNLTMTVQKVAEVPEPLTLSIFAAGMAGMAGIAVRRRRMLAKV